MAESRVFAYGALTVRVESDDPAALLWLEEFLTPSFVVTDTADPVCQVGLVIDDGLYQQTHARGCDASGETIASFVLDTEIVALPVWRSANDERVLFDERFQVFYSVTPDRRRVRLITLSNNLRARFALMRVVREYAMSSAQAGDSLMLHGAALAVGANGLVIAGPKGAGKTTLLIHLLHQARADFVSNDRVVADLEPVEPMWRGMPTVVSIRTPMLDFFPEFQQHLADCRYHHLLAAAEQESGARPPERTAVRTKVSLSPPQLCHLLGTKMRPGARARALLFPRVAEEEAGLRLSMLSAEAAAERLLGGLFAAEWAPAISAVFAIGTSAAPPTPARRLALVRKLRCFEAVLGRQAYTRTTAAGLLDELLQPGSSS
jgi:hypothetical protein